MIPYLRQQHHVEEDTNKRIWCKYHKQRPHRYKDEISKVDIPMHKIVISDSTTRKVEFVCDDCKKQQNLKLWWYKEYTHKKYHQPRERIFVLGKGATCKSWADNFQRLEEWRLY